MSTAESQNCPVYTAGYTGQTAIHDSSSGRLYVNEAQSHRVQCDGTVYRWHYCYYDAQSSTDLEVAFGAYDEIGQDLQYRLRLVSQVSRIFPRVRMRV